MAKGKTSSRAAVAIPSPLDHLSPLKLDLLCIALLYAVTLFVFRGIVFNNAAFAAEGDTAASLSYTHAGDMIHQAEGVDVLWMPYFFSGMPTFGNVAYGPHDVSYLQKAVAAVLNLFYLNGTWTWLVVFYFLAGLFMFLLSRTWNFGRIASLIAALTFMLSPYVIRLAEEGHGSKLMAVSYLPLVMMFTHLLFQRRDLLSFGLLAASVGTLFLTNHMQIVYYVLFMIGFYLVYQIVLDYRENRKLIPVKALLLAGAAFQSAQAQTGPVQGVAKGTATVGVGVRGGAEASLAAADVFLAGEGLGPLVTLVTGAARVLGVIRLDIAISLVYNLVGAALAMSGRIDPLLAAVLMPASSLTVVLVSWLGRTFEGPRA